MWDGRIRHRGEWFKLVGDVSVSSSLHLRWCLAIRGGRRVVSQCGSRKFRQSLEFSRPPTTNAIFLKKLTERYNFIVFIFFNNFYGSYLLSHRLDRLKLSFFF